MDQFISRPSPPLLEPSSNEYPIKPTKTEEWGSMRHPLGSVSSLSTASGGSGSICSSFSSFSAACSSPSEETEFNNFANNSNSNTNSSTYTSSYSINNNSSSSTRASWSGSSCSTGSISQGLKHHYVGVFNSAAPRVPLNSLNIPPNTVSITDTSPAWAQYQYTFTGSSISSSNNNNSSSSSASGCCTPVYCSLTPTPTAKAPSSPLQPNLVGRESSGRREAAATGAASVSEAEEAARATTTAPGSADTSSLSIASDGNTRRRSSLLLNEQPLPVTSLPQEVQAALQQERGGSCRSSSVPDWFDVQTGCIKKELLPQLPSYRSTLNTSVAKLSAASRVHHRIRWPGESAKAAAAAANIQHMHHRFDAGVAAAASSASATRSSFPGAGAPHAAAAAASPAGGIMRRKSDSFAVGFHSREADRTPLRSSSHFFASESPAAISPAGATTNAAAAAQPPRSRRVRFATVPTAREYRELSPYQEADPSSVSPAAALGANSPHKAAAAGEQQQQRMAGAASPATGGVYSRSSNLLNKMTQMLRRLLNHPPLQQNQQARESLEASLLLLESFGAECGDRPPSLSCFCSCLESCKELVEMKLPLDEEKPLEELVKSAAQPILSREAVLKLHRMRLQMQQTPELELFLTPLETLQRLQICDRRRATSGLCLHAATADEALIEKQQHTQPNVFLLQDFACGVVSTRRWQRSRTPRAFAASMLQQLQHQLLQQSVPQGEPCMAESDGASRVKTGPPLDFQVQRHFSLIPLVEAALRQTTEWGCCSLGVLSMDPSGEKVRFATSGFMRLLVLRRSPASGILCRIAEAPVRNAAIAAESQLFRWPGVEELLNRFKNDNTPALRREHGKREEKTAACDQGTRRQGLMRIVEWADIGTPWSCRGLVEQEVFVQEGDFFVIADESEWISTEKDINGRHALQWLRSYSM